MADEQNNKVLANEAAETLLTAIKETAETARTGGNYGTVSTALLNLAQAYATVQDARPKSSSAARVR